MPRGSSRIRRPPPVDRGRRPRRRWTRRALLVAAAAIVVAAGYYLVCLYQVWHSARSDETTESDAIVVLEGAAQYDGRPSPVLAARLDHALLLWKAGYTPPDRRHGRQAAQGIATPRPRRRRTT